jgi:hypothetical protein
MRRVYAAAVFLMCLFAPSLGWADRIDVADFQSVLGGAHRIRAVSWIYAFAEESPRSFSEVWFDGDLYTYIYHIEKPIFIGGVDQAIGEEKNNLLEIPGNFGSHTHWGFVLDCCGANDPPVGSTRPVAIGVGGSSVGDEPPDIGPLMLEADRLFGSVGFGSPYFYAQSRQGPKLVDALAIFDPASCA